VKISIIIPTIKRVDLLEECLAPIVKYSEQFDELYLVDNGQQDLTNIREMCKDMNVVYNLPETNLGCPVSFNQGLTYLKNRCDWVLILNDDIVLSENCVVKIHKLFRSRKHKWLLSGERSFCVFALNTSGLSGMEYAPGKYFDEAFYPAYCEDVDFRWRMHLLDNTRIEKGIKLLTPEVFRKRASSEDRQTFKKKYRIVRKYFCQKWGNGPAQPKFKIPFNGAKPWPSTGEEKGDEK